MSTSQNAEGSPPVPRLFVWPCRDTVPQPASGDRSLADRGPEVSRTGTAASALDGPQLMFIVAIGMFIDIHANTPVV